MIEKIILGTVQMGITYGVNNSRGKVSLEESHKILKLAFSNGLRSLDTAEAYGDAHQVIGKFHEENPDKQFKVTTKIPPSREPGKIEEKVKQYLQELKVERLECLMFHGLNAYNENKDILPVLTQLKKENVFSLLGVSVYTNPEIETLLDDENVDLLQIPFNVLDNNFLKGKVLDRAKEQNKIIHSRSCFLQGLFFMDHGDPHPAVQGLKEPLEKFHQIAERKKKSVATLALQYCLQQDNLDQVLIGVDSAIQLQINMDSIAEKLDEETLKEINEIKVKETQYLNPSNWTK